MEKSLREIINEYRNKIKDSTNLTPELAANYLVEITSYMGNVNERLLDAQMAYNDKLQDTLDEIKSVAKAQIKAQCSQEYRNLQEVKGYQSLMTEIIRGLKYYLRALGDEYGFSKS